MIGPVEIFQHENDGRRRGERFERPAELAQHSLACLAEDLALQTFSVRGRQDRRELCQPGRCMLGEKLDHTRPLRRLTQAPDGFEHRVIRFLLAMAFDALAGGDAGAAVHHLPTEEALDQGRLADAGLTGDEDDLPVSAERPTITGREKGQIRLTTEQPSGAFRIAGRGPRRVVFRDRSDEAIPSPGVRSDEGRVLGIITEQAAKLPDVGLENLLLDVGPGPQRFHQLVLGDEAAGPGDQMVQHGEGLRRQRQRLAVPPDTLVVGIQPEGSE
jgi:hypothetical protein